MRRCVLWVVVTAGIGSGALVPNAPAAEPKVTLTDQGQGRLVLRVESDGGARRETYRIGIAKHYHPDTGPSDRMKEWASWRLGAFCCFNTNQFTGKEHCRARDPKVFAPPVLDVAGWVRAYKSAGMKYAVLTTRHTSGFLLWNSRTTDFDIGSAIPGKDLVKDYVAECRKQGIAPGLYYCMWGGKKRGDVPGAKAVILAQLYELAKDYGKIPYFWIDMMNWAPEDLPPQLVYDVLRNLQPWSVVILNQHVQDGTEIRYFPTDVMNGEIVLPPEAGHNPRREVKGTTYDLPFEHCLCSQKRKGGIKYDPLGPSCWFTYGEGRSFEPSEPFAAEVLAERLRLSWKRGTSNVLLSVAPDHTGRMRDADVAMLKRLGELLGTR